MNRLFTSTEIKFVSPGPEDFTGSLSNLSGRFNTLLKLFQTAAEEGTFLNLFYEATITLIPKPDKDITQKKNITGQYH